MVCKQLVAWIILIVLPFTTVNGQEDEDCGKVSNKKIIKLLDQAKDSKYDSRERYQFLKDALAIDENCAPCLFEIGKKAYRKSQDDGTTSQYAEEYLKRLIDVCPNYHADPYYYMGVIYYGKSDYENTILWFNKFLDFKVKDDSQTSSKHYDQVADVKDILPELEFYDKFYKAPVSFEPKIVENVSTASDELLPMLSPDNEIIFYTRRVDRKSLDDLTRRTVEEFTMSMRSDIHSPFDGGKALPPPFNVGDNFGGATISVDNKEMIICACKKDNPDYKDYNNCDLYSSKYEKVYNMNTEKYEFKWSSFENLGGAINSKDSWEAQPSLSGDGKTLYFTKVSKSTGKHDIYYSTKDKEGNWTKALPMKNINTAGDEKTPFMHSDSKTLYFAAETGPDYWGAGELDIFYVKQNDDGSWGKPKNIGYPINTEGHEHGLIVSTDGHWAYLSSNKQQGARGYDIIRFELPREARPEKVVLVKGQITDEKDEPVNDAVVEIKYSNSDKTEEIKVNKDDGKYAVVVNVEKGNDAVITVKKPDHTVDTKIIASTSEPVLKNVNLKTEAVEVGKPYTINDILFATDSYELTAKSKFVIDQFVLFLKEHPSYKIAIHGHTDDVGDNEKNRILSENRSNAVKDYIISRGISATSLTAQGFGEEKPKVPNTNDYNRSLNRRTEFVITGK